MYLNEFDSLNKGINIEECTHSLRLGPSLCAICGAETLDNNFLFAASHTSDEFFKTSVAAHKEQEIKNEKLYKNKKMILILDLDQTLIHTTMNNMPCDLKYSFNERYYYTKYRPYLKSFLKKLYKLFEMHIYTMGSRDYADKICEGIDPTGKLFNGRIVSRDENFNELKKNIFRISCIDDNVIILDDRGDVWDYVTNLILIKPYYYYNNIDINDPSIIQQNRDMLMQEKTNNLNQITNTSVDNYSIIQEKYPVIKNEINTFVDNYLISEEKYPIVEKEIKKRNEKIQYKNTILINNDKELLRIYKILKKVHKKYFKNRKKISELLKLTFLKGYNFICSYKNIDLIKFLGGSINFKNPDYVIESVIYAKEFESINISMDWIYECIYKRKLINVDRFIINDFRNKEKEEEINKFIEEFY